MIVHITMWAVNIYLRRSVAFIHSKKLAALFWIEIYHSEITLLSYVSAWNCLSLSYFYHLEIRNFSSKKYEGSKHPAVTSGFFWDACLEDIGGWFLRYLEFLERFVEFFGHFVEFFGKLLEFLATLLEFLKFIYLFSPKPMILLTFPIVPCEKDEFF